MLKALTDEEAQTVVTKFEDGKAEVEKARRVEADQRRAGARQEREQAEQKEVDDRERKAREAARQKEADDRQRKC